jgi:hypothetical protein
MGNCLFNKKKYVEEYTMMRITCTSYQKKYKRNVKYRSSIGVALHAVDVSRPPILTKQNNELCCKSWDQITNSIADETGNSISGITAFYNDFTKE